MPAGGMMIAGAMAAASIGGAIIGSIAGAKDRKQAREMMGKAMAELEAVGLPPDLSQKILYEKFKVAGILTPEMEQDLGEVTTEFAKLKEDPTLRAKQMDALTKMSQYGKTGLRPEDRAQLGQILDTLRTSAEGKKEQIQNEFAARGQAGSGTELISELQASQGADQLASQQGMELAAMASKNAMAAIQAQSEMAGTIRGQDFQVNSAKAQAKDEMAKFNYGYTAARQQRNVLARNQAQATNLENLQTINNANTQQENTERLRQVEAKRQYWADRLSLAQAKAGAYTGQAQYSQSESQRKANMGSSIGSGVGQGIGAGAQYSAYTNAHPATVAPAGTSAPIMAGAGGPSQTTMDYNAAHEGDNWQQ
jgi:hypothetical protein